MKDLRRIIRDELQRNRNLNFWCGMVIGILVGGSVVMALIMIILVGDCP